MAEIRMYLYWGVIHPETGKIIHAIDSDYTHGDLCDRLDRKHTKKSTQ